MTIGPAPMIRIVDVGPFAPTVACQRAVSRLAAQVLLGQLQPALRRRAQHQVVEALRKRLQVVGAGARFRGPP